MPKSDQPRIYECCGPERHTWLDRDDAAKCCNGYRREKRIIRDEDGARLEFYWQAVETPVTADGQLQPAGQLRATPREINLLGHTPFFDRLAQFTDTAAPAWKSICAGMLTMRVIDRYAADRESARAPTFREYHWVRSAVDELEEGQVRDVLGALLDAARGIDESKTLSIPKLLFSYAWLLEDEAEWGVAEDVYNTVIEHANNLDEPDARPWSYCRLAYCLRQQGNVKDAAGALRRGRKVARDLKDVPAELRLRVAEANLTIHRGNISLASAQLDAVIADARSAGAPEALARALHDRGVLAREGDRHEEAAALLYEAYVTYTDEQLQVRVLHDLALTAKDLGWRDTARDAFLVLYLDGSRRESHLVAAINLMEIAADDGDAVSFERYRQALEDQPLSARHAASFQLRAAEGYRRFGRRSFAEVAYRTLLRHAEDHGLNEFIVKALDGLKADAPSPPLRSAPVPVQFAPVATTLRSRRLALTGAMS